MSAGLADRVAAGDPLALARAISLVEDGLPEGEAILAALFPRTGRATGVGITGDILYGPAQVHALLADAAAAGVLGAYREVTTIKGHDAFLIEWDQLSVILADALEDGVARVEARKALPLPA